MECLVRVIQGPDKGQEHRLLPGPQVVGRGARAAVRVTPEDVSWEHAVITRDGDDYYIENLSAVGTWVGDAKVGGKVRIRAGDKVRLSPDCVLRLEPADGSGAWRMRGALAAAFVAMLGLCVAMLFYNAGTRAAEDDWDAAHRSLATWAEQQAARRRLPPEGVDLFRRAWRLEQAKDYEHSRSVWVRLQIVLAGAEPTLHCLELAGKDPNDRTLQKMLAAPPQPGSALTDEERAAAMGQFVRRRLTFSTKQVGTSRLR